MRLWGRKWRVTVGTLTSSDIDIRFQVRRTLTTHPGTCEIELYGLSANHRRELQGITRGAAVRLEAGYQEAMPIIFQGDAARRADIKRDGADWVATVTAGDGEHALRRARLGRSFGPDTTLAQAVQYAAGVAGVDVGNLLDAVGSATVGSLYPEGVVLHGPLARRLTEMLNAAGLTWSVQDGAFQALPRGQALGRQAIVIDADHGMIDSPEIGKNRVVTVRCLLQPDLVPGQLVSLNSQIVSGTYRIEKCELSGETKGDDWNASLDLRAAS